MENNSFKISYDGPALTNHEMNVKDLAPALLAVGELLEDANNILNGEKAKVVVNIKATNPGSVDVLFSVCQDLLAQATSLFSSNGVNAIVNAKTLLDILGVGLPSSGGVIGIILWVRNRKIKNITKIEGNGFKIQTEDNDVRIVSGQEIKLFGFLNIRKNLEAIIKKPLEKEGVDKICFSKDKNRSTNVIEKKDIELFSAPEVEQELIDESEVEMSLQIVNISLQEGGKWRFSDGNATFFAEIKDKDFVNKILKNEEVFAKDDLLKVVMKRKQYLSGGGISTDYEILKIVEHRSAAIQIKLPFSE
jgi:hypothetical protein